MFVILKFFFGDKIDGWLGKIVDIIIVVVIVIGVVMIFGFGVV